MSEEDDNNNNDDDDDDDVVVVVEDDEDDEDDVGVVDDDDDDDDEETNVERGEGKAWGEKGSERVVDVSWFSIEFEWVYMKGAVAESLNRSCVG